MARFLLQMTRIMPARFFLLIGIYHNAKRKKRYDRFCQEIVTQKELSKKMKGVLSVTEYCFPKEMSEKQPAWFRMPKAQKFDIYDGRTFEEKLGVLIELGEIISILHYNGMAHRDIKPENILWYDEKIHLSDYGLVWFDGKSTLTNYPERMGPIKIMPPELEACEDINSCDYRKSDVYLFAKVTWMYLKKDNYGFKGPYNRGANQIYLRRESYNCNTLEPLHMMMIEATKDDWSERIDITVCLDYLRKQQMVLREEINKDELERFILNENLSFFDETVKPNVKIYTGRDEINDLLESVIPLVEIEVFDELGHKSMRPKRFRRIDEEVFVFFEELPNGFIKRAFLSVTQAEKSEEKIVLRLKSVDLHSIKEMRKEQDWVLNKTNVVYIYLSDKEMSRG